MADTNPRDRDPNAPEARDRPAASVGGWLPLDQSVLTLARSG